MDEAKQFASYLAASMKRMGLDSTELSRRTALGRVTISRHLNGHRIPHYSTRTIYARVFGLTPDEFELEWRAFNSPRIQPPANNYPALVLDFDTTDPATSDEQAFASFAIGKLQDSNVPITRAAAELKIPSVRVLRHLRAELLPTEDERRRYAQMFGFDSLKTFDEAWRTAPEKFWYLGNATYRKLAKIGELTGEADLTKVLESLVSEYHERIDEPEAATVPSVGPAVAGTIKPAPERHRGAARTIKPMKGKLLRGGRPPAVTQVPSAMEGSDWESLLSSTERAVLQGLLNGKSIAEIANDLGKSQMTVLDCQKKLYKHFQVNTREQLRTFFPKPKDSSS